MMCRFANKKRAVAALNIWDSLYGVCIPAPSLRKGVRSEDMA